MTSNLHRALGGLLLLCVCLNLGQASNFIKAAPYFMPLGNDPQGIDDIVANSGVRHFIFAFILAPDQNQCLPTWDGQLSQPIETDTKILEMVAKIRSHGGDLSVSVGGYNGVELGKACKSVEALAAAYQAIIDKYQLTHMDFDIEGDDLGVADEEIRRFQAIQILKEKAVAKGRPLHVTLTLPVTSIGLSDLGKSEIKRAIAVQRDLIDQYKIMAFDYAGPGANMAADVERIMELVHQQLLTLRTDLKEAEVYAHTGMILMNGKTDQPSELFTMNTFRYLVEYAQRKNVGRVSYWSLNRDRPCPGDQNVGWVSGTCSSIAQQPWEFTKIIAKFDPSNGLPDNGQTSVPVTPGPTGSPATSGPTVPPQTNVCVNIIGEEYLPFSGDCHKYIYCFNGAQYTRTCPGELIFDFQLLVCNWANQVDRPECQKKK